MRVATIGLFKDVIVADTEGNITNKIQRNLAIS